MLTKTVENCKQMVKPIENELILGLVIVLVALIGFGLGRLSKLEEGRTPIVVEKTAASAGLSTTGIVGKEGNIVASKNGTKYHFLWCSGASSIKEENKIYFATKEEAEKAGYKPAANCKGL